MAKQEQKREMKKEEATSTACTDRRCPFHGEIRIRGREFKGYVKKIVSDRAVIEWERIIYHTKYERYSKKKSKVHAHIPQCLKSNVKIGDYVKIGECRPLSKIMHFIVLEIVK